MVPESTHLGKTSSYPRHYDPSLLVAVPRSENREHLGIGPANLPFSGVDVWHAYEFSFLINSGLPVNGILKIIYPSNSLYLVESKSLKLYLHSFNMERLGPNRADGLACALEMIRKDLRLLLKCDVQISFFDHKTEALSSDFDGFSIMEDCIDTDTLCCESYRESPELLTSTGLPGEIHWGTHLLRSRCKITLQPDWGTVFVAMKSTNLPDAAGFLKYIVSLRDENHFHEEICESIFTRLNQRFSPSALRVTCLYTRRGGIDICPARSLRADDLPEKLCTIDTLTRPVFRQ
ncbi:MAG TPA: NADPH-dependent 7-cyano-7-deazaguanine reductase QueF [Prolixibacteraceae bacterium]|nr:NADPH-dependent 7-cyano-7-deazaguanine reductase QueF [Prolixibacteraceae bacterium]